MVAEPVRFGIGANWQQFVLLSLITFWVGSVVGVERVAVPVLGRTVFHLASYVVLLSFIVSFGLVKATMNLVAGGLADRVGRRPLLVAGWVVALPVPFMIAWAPNWAWIAGANVLVGVNQGLAWSMSVTSKIDLAGPHQRGSAAGLNEFSGYAGVSVGGFVGGLLAAQSARTLPAIFLLAVVLVALGMSALSARESQGFARSEGGAPANDTRVPDGSSTLFRAFARGSWKDRRLAACSQAGLVEKFVDTMAWGFLPLFLLGRGFSIPSIALVTSVYTGSWAVLQLVFGPLSDRWGRRWSITVGMVLAGAGVAAVGIFATVPAELAAALAMGIGMAMLYPALLATVADLAPPRERGAVLGVYRFWRDSGYFLGGLALGVVADGLGAGATFAFAAGLMVLSAGVFAWALAGSEPPKDLRVPAAGS